MCLFMCQTSLIRSAGTLSGVMKNKYQTIKQKWNKWLSRVDVSATQCIFTAVCSPVCLKVNALSHFVSYQVEFIWGFKRCDVLVHCTKYSSITEVMALLNIFICIYEQKFHHQKCYCSSWTILHNEAKMKSNQRSFLKIIIF